MPNQPPPRYTLRQARPDDAVEIARLFTELGHAASADAVGARWRAWTAAGGVAIVADAADSGLLGIATLSRTPVLHRAWPVGRITALVVDARWRGAGIGKALVLACEREHAAYGCGLVEVTSNIRRGDAHAFYERLGYERTSYRFGKMLPAPPQPAGGTA